jgi:hypothetical protein
MEDTDELNTKPHAAKTLYFFAPACRQGRVKKILIPKAVLLLP